MAYSIYTAYGDGVTNQFTISFGLGYIDKADVKCRVNKEVDGLGQPSYRPLTWITDSLVQVGGTVPANGNLVEFIRTVSKTSLVHDYSDGVEIQEKNLDDSNKQILMAVQEVLDGRFESGLATDLDFANHKAINIAAGTNPNDAVNLTQLEDMTGNAPAYAAAAAASAESAITQAGLAITQAGLATTAKEAAETAAAEAASIIASIPVDKLNGTVAPTINDDNSYGYSLGSKWYDLIHDEAYICLDAASGAAVWAKATLTLEELTPLFATATQGIKADTALQSLPAATNAESNAGSLSTVAVVPSNFAQHSLTASGYQKFPGGLIVQWGRSGNISANSSAGVTFPIPFPNAVFSVTCTNDRTQDNTGSIAVLSISLSSFSVGNSHDSTNGAYWIAWGY